MITVLIVDNHEIARIGIKYTLLSMSKVKVVAEAARGLDALRLAKELKPQVVFMDIQMPGIDGLETTRKMILANPSIKIIILSAIKDEPYPTRLLEAGAMGYLTKGCPADEIIKALRTVTSGKRYITPTIAQQLALKHVSDEYNTVFDTLSLRELQIALLIIEGREIQDIANTFFISPKTIMAYRHQIFKKLNITNEVQLVLLANQEKLIKQDA